MLTLDPATAGVPLIVATPDSEALRQHQGQFANQGILVLLKPYALEDLLLLVNEKLALGRRRAEA